MHERFGIVLAVVYVLMLLCQESMRDCAMTIGAGIPGQCLLSFLRRIEMVAQ